MSEIYRISGGCLSVNAAWVDVEVTNVTIDGDVTLTSTTSTKTWTITLDNFDEWREEGRVADRSDIVNVDHPVWDSLNTAYTELGNDTNIENTESLQQKTQYIFKSILKQHTEE